MKALKLKLLPTEEQYPILDELFKKWASLCTRLSNKNLKHEALFPPKDAEGIWFSKTQLNQIETDVNNHKKALSELLEQKQEFLNTIAKRRDTLLEMLKDDAKKDFDQNNSKNFRPREWVNAGLLKTRFHTRRYWENQIGELSRLEERLKQTVERIKKGRIRFKAKKISLHPNSFMISFAASKLILKPFHDTDKKIELRLVTEPLQPSIGSSKRSKKFLVEGIRDYLAYSLYRHFFGMNRTEKKLMQAKRPEKVAKFEEMMRSKEARLGKKIRKVEKLLGRELNGDERSVLETEAKAFFSNPSVYEHTDEFKQLVHAWAKDVAAKEEPFHLNKYPILFRKPINKRKKLKNLKSYEWKYYFQISYEPFPPEAFKPKTILGIDRGLNHLLAIAIFDPVTKNFVVNKLVPNPIRSWKWKRRKLRRSIQHLERRIRAQKNVHILENQMKKRIRSILDKIENEYHRVSREIVNLAKEKNAVIVFENLQNMKQHGRRRGQRLARLNYELSLFDYGKIASFVHYKATSEGVPVYDILPAGTSQTCARCLLERGSPPAPITLFYWEDFLASKSLPAALLERHKFSEAMMFCDGKHPPKSSTKHGESQTNVTSCILSRRHPPTFSVKSSDGNRLKITLEKKKDRVLLSQEDGVLEYFSTVKVGNKTAVQADVYRRNQRNKKIGICITHSKKPSSEIDADLNAARVIAISYWKNLNKPLPYGTRKVFKRSPLK